MSRYICRKTGQEPRRKSPRHRLFALSCLSIFGILWHLLFKQDFKKSRMFYIRKGNARLNSLAGCDEKREMTAVTPVLKEFQSLIFYNLETSGAVLTDKNSVQIYTDGREKFRALKEALKEAEHFIHIQYYIIKDDEVFDSIAPILEKKAGEGVEVRLLCDGMGGRFMPKKRWKKLQAAGIQTGKFFPPFFGFLNLRMNYRNHRKIVVIDGKTGFVGGFNIGREYISKDPAFGYWRDTHLKITGEAAISLELRFALDWNYASGENLFREEKYFRAVPCEEKRIPLQVITSGPDTGQPYIRNNYLELFHRAGRQIDIQTPYFVPDDAILSALKIAALSGVKVRLMIPCKPDHPFVYWATCSYAGELLECGGKVYIYEGGFLHAKGVVIDGKVCCYGTANMDIRSFALNFEVNAVIYDEETTGKMEEIFENDLLRCRELTKEEYESRGFRVRAKERAGRLLSPLL